MQLELVVLPNNFIYNLLVVWNPWVENAKKMSDFDDDGYKTMICVEPGYVSERVVIQPGKVKDFAQSLKVVA